MSVSTNSLFVDRFRALQAVWPSEVDLFSAAWNCQLPKFVSWIPQPNATAECLLSQLGESTSVRFSPVGIDSEMPLEDQERECGSRSNLPAVAVTALVAVTVGDGNRSPSGIPVASPFVAFKRIDLAPAPVVGKFHSVRLDVIRRRLQDRGFSSRVIELLLASSRGSTTASHKSAWNC